jgi:hypothetical protein
MADDTRATPNRRPASIRSTITGEGYSKDGHRCDSYVKKQRTDLFYGANYVHYRYFELFWEYNFSRPFLPWMLPLGLLLVGSQAASADIGSITFDLLKYACTSVFLVAGILGGILQLAPICCIAVDTFIDACFGGGAHAQLSTEQSCNQTGTNPFGFSRCFEFRGSDDFFYSTSSCTLATDARRGAIPVLVGDSLGQGATDYHRVDRESKFGRVIYHGSPSVGGWNVCR